VRALGFAIAMVLGCASKQPADRLRLDELSTRDGPVLSSRHDSDSCATIYAVDGSGQGWYEQDCPGPVVLRKSKQVAYADLEKLKTLYNGLPTPDPCTAATSKDTYGYVTTLARRDVSGQSTWIACTAKDTAGIPRMSEPYKSADAFLVSVTKP